MTSPLHSMFKVDVAGTCLFCGEANLKVVTSTLITYGVPPCGVCDLCSYALRHAWKRELGEVVGATSPKVVSTYVLVPRLPEGKNELDVAAYEFLVVAPSVKDESGLRWRLPSCEFSDSREVLKQLNERLGIVTWDVTLREIYLGYSGTGEFANVQLAWAWGALPGKKRHMTGGVWKNFASLLSIPILEAGFYLGIKAAFEALLWQREVAGAVGTTEDPNPVAIVLGEGAVRCLDEAEDPKMVELFLPSLTPAESEVLRLVQESRASKAALAREQEARLQAESQNSPGSPGNETEPDEGDSEVGGPLLNAPGIIDPRVPPGYARSPR